jgi:membrane protein required for colicin V production
VNALDIGILILLFLFAIGGVRRGLVWELLTTIGLGVGLLATFYYRRELAGLVSQFADPGWEQQWAAGLIFLAFFLLIYIGFAIVGRKLHNMIDKSPFKWGDRILGVAAGVLKGAVMISFLVIVAEWMDTSGDVRDYLNKSQLIRWGKQTAHSMTHWESDEMRQRV